MMVPAICCAAGIGSGSSASTNVAPAYAVFRALPYSRDRPPDRARSSENRARRRYERPSAALERSAWTGRRGSRDKPDYHVEKTEAKISLLPFAQPKQSGLFITRLGLWECC